MKRPILLLAGLALLISACTPVAPPVTGEPATKTPPPAPTHSPATSSLQPAEAALRGLQVEVWHPWFGTDASLFENMVEEFNGSNPWGIVMTSTGQMSYSLLYENVRAALPTENRPDLVIALPEQARTWDADGFVADLAAYVGDPVYGWTSEEIRDFPSVFWLQDASGQRRIALPFQRSARFLLWNQTWGTELGFLTPPANPEEFRQQACRATQSLISDTLADNNGLGGWLVDTESMTALSWMQAFEGGVLEGNDYRFLTPNNIAAFTFVRKLQEDGCAWMPAEGLDPLAAFAGRNALFVTAALEQFPLVTRAFAAAGNTDEWIPLAFPGESKDSLVIYGSSLVMLKSTEPEQLATWLFMEWLLSPENDARSARTNGLFPLRTSARALLGDYESSHPQWARALDLAQEGNLQPQLASWRVVRVMLGDGFTQMFRVSLPSGQVPVILAQMESTARELGK